MVERHRTFFRSAAAWTLLLTAGAGSLAEGFPAVTRPSKQVLIAFLRPGQIATVAVEEGQVVKKGQVLIALDDRAEQARVAQLKAEAENEVEVLAAKAQFDQAEVELLRTQEAADKGAAPPLELQHARLQRDIARLRVDLSKFQKEQSLRRYDEERLQVERMTLTAPMDGRVENIQAEAGESVDALKPLIRVVQADPLWIDVMVPVSTASGLKIGQRAAARVDASRYNDPVDYRLEEGKVIHIESGADAASNRVRVRVVVPNPAQVPYGLHVLVEFPSSQTATTGKATGALADQTLPKGDVNVREEERQGSRSPH